MTELTKLIWYVFPGGLYLLTLLMIYPGIAEREARGNPHVRIEII